MESRFRHFSNKQNIFETLKDKIDIKLNWKLFAGTSITECVEKNPTKLNWN